MSRVEVGRSGAGRFGSGRRGSSRKGGRDGRGPLGGSGLIVVRLVFIGAIELIPGEPSEPDQEGRRVPLDGKLAWS